VLNQVEKQINRTQSNLKVVIINKFKKLIQQIDFNHIWVDIRADVPKDVIDHCFANKYIIVCTQNSYLFKQRSFDAVFSDVRDIRYHSAGSVFTNSRLLRFAEKKDSSLGVFFYDFVVDLEQKLLKYKEPVIQDILGP
jgi:hypothetical protein